MRRRRIQTRIHIVQIRAKLGPRLRPRNRIIQPINKLRRRARHAVILDHPQAIPVAVGREVGCFRIDGGAGAAVEVDDGEEVCLRAGASHIVVEGSYRCRGEARGLGHGQGFREEGVVFVVAGQGLLDCAFAAYLDEVVVVRVRRDDDVCGRGQCAQEFWPDLGIEFADGAEEGAARREAAVAVHVDAEGDAAVDDGAVACEVLEVEEGVCEGGFGVPDAVEGDFEVGYAGWRVPGLQPEICDDGQGVCGPSDAPVDIFVLG